MKKQRLKTYVLWIAVTEAVGALSGWLTREGNKIYQATAVKPPLTPPPIVFPIVWAILFLLLGIGIARIWLAPRSADRTNSLWIFTIQLCMNFLWSIIFFNLQAYGFALLWLLILWGVILWMILTFRKVDTAAAWLQLPYLLWVTFAAYLNAGVWLLNR